jgi:hypothetical protein
VSGVQGSVSALSKKPRFLQLSSKTGGFDVLIRHERRGPWGPPWITLSFWWRLWHLRTLWLCLGSQRQRTLC